MKANTFVLLGALMILPALAQADDLLSIYTQALAADPVLAGASATRGVQQEAATQARAALLPQWSLAADKNQVNPGSANTNLLASHISQSLLDIGQWRSLAAENTLLSAQDERLRAAQQALCARVANAYFAVLIAQAGLNTAQANEAAFAEQVKQAQSRFEAGLSAQLDVDQARTYHQLVRGNVVQAEQGLADAKQGLAEITGSQPGELAALVQDLPALAPQPQDPQAWVERALIGNPQLKASALAVSASERRIEAARAGHLPTLSLGLDSERRSPNDSPGARTINTVGLKLNIPLFAGGATQSQVRQAGYRRDAAQGEQEQTRRALIRETQAQYQAVLAAMAQMDSSRLAVAAANQALASTKAGQALGLRNMTDLLLAIQTQASAQNAHEQARHRYVLAKLLLSAAAGALDATELAGVNQWLQQTSTERKSS
ncbi:TolC family outer membrane protein [Roseateles oligotrophus]|uniref:TolC family outer membrane protein n=1 Tax=Roseateles oligotrophus TaxID=1769250 RepID=A0ABT2YIV4_9BURK|nr:TolC family outer membrane protein [Roseateles oligotrophus]MCV2369865.1 TolC family outer membrane protein [Roseateles oligotrophus]